MLLVGQIDRYRLYTLLDRYGLNLTWVLLGEPIPGSFWGESEAGLIDARIYARPDTPLHSLLHEMAHYACMSPERRMKLHTDTQGDEAEESAVCYLQILMARWLSLDCRDRIVEDMDAWGYSFRLGSAAQWFDTDAVDARDWLSVRGLIDVDGCLTFALAENRAA